jgi:hypothetical protein
MSISLSAFPRSAIDIPFQKIASTQNKIDDLAAHLPTNTYEKPTVSLKATKVFL